MTIAQLRTSKIAAGRKVARSLGTTEEAIDDTIVAQAMLLTAIIDGRREMGGGIQVAHSAFKKAAASLQALTTARDLVIDCHADLARVRDHYRLRADDLGCTPDKGVPPGGMMPEEEVSQVA